MFYGLQLHSQYTEEHLLSVRQIGCVVGLEVLEEVLAHVHTAKDIMCKEDKVGTGVHHDMTMNIGIALSLTSPTT